MSHDQIFGLVSSNVALCEMVKAVCRQEGVGFYQVIPADFSAQMYLELNPCLVILDLDTLTEGDSTFWKDIMDKYEANLVALKGEVDLTNIEYKRVEHFPVSPALVKDIIQKGLNR